MTLTLDMILILVVVIMISFWVYHKVRYLRKKMRLQKQYRERMERRRIEREIYDIWATEHGYRNNVRNYLDGLGWYYTIPRKDPIKPIKKPMYHHFT